MLIYTSKFKSNTIRKKEDKKRNKQPICSIDKINKRSRTERSERKNHIIYEITEDISKNNNHFGYRKKKISKKIIQSKSKGSKESESNKHWSKIPRNLFIIFSKKIESYRIENSIQRREKKHPNIKNKKIYDNKNSTKISHCSNKKNYVINDIFIFSNSHRYKIIDCSSMRRRKTRFWNRQNYTGKRKILSYRKIDTKLIPCIRKRERKKSHKKLNFIHQRIF